ncbi:glutathione S-transferase [Crepidotus variabilis]|uniref:Glutathione S-transferase n=1 Tax=Crepidotus variabilis TaxID=179855 RepID=A0A9P6ECN7_9AGAR|nr:glutathione S-transferase [Crepidotus variabilis]
MTSTEAPILLYTVGTANGNSVSVAFEEIKGLYPDTLLSYDWKQLDIMKKAESKEPWFIKLNPNGRIPIIVDRSRNDFVVFETSAILLYAAQQYDKSFKLWFNPEEDIENYSTMLQWLFFGHGGIGPMQGQANFFNFTSKGMGPADAGDVTFSLKRYQNEVKRLYGVLQIRLGDREYLAGSGKGKYSLADIKIVPWLRVRSIAGIESLDEWPSVKSWVQRCESRPGFQAGLKIATLPKF